MTIPRRSLGSPGLKNSYLIIIAVIVVVAAAAVLSVLVYSNIRKRETRVSVQHFEPGQTTAAEAVPGQVTDQQNLTLSRITGRTEAEMLGLVANMSTTQRRMLARRLSDGAGNLAEIAGFFKAWASIDSLAAFSAATDFRLNSQKEAALRAIFQGCEAEKASQLINRLKDMPIGSITPDLAQDLLTIGLGKWSQIDPQSASDFLSNYSEAMSINQAVYREIAKNWASQDPPAAIAWKNKQSSSDLQQNMSLGIFQSWVATDPAKAMQYARDHLSDPDGNANAAAVSNTLVDRDPAAAKAFVESLPASVQATAAVSAVMRMAYDDPAGAAAWVAQLPREIQEGPAGAVASQYAAIDPRAAKAWINTLSGDVHDSALAGYAMNARDKADAILTALQISDEQKRSTTAKALADRWNSIDPGSFHQWLTASGLPIETQRALTPTK